MRFLRNLAIGLIVGALVAALPGTMMLDNNNQGEFTNTVTGRWTAHFWQIMLGITGVVGVIVALSLSILHFAKDEHD